MDLQTWHYVGGNIVLDLIASSEFTGSIASIESWDHAMNCVRER